MKRNRLRRALLPTWPPESPSEAMLLLVCAAAMGLLIALWALPGSAILAQPRVDDAAVALLAALARPVALGLLLALAARLLLAVPPALALGLGALLLAGTWPAPLIEGTTTLTANEGVWLSCACVALLALPAARLAGARMPAGLLLGLIAALLVLAVARYDMAHAWVLDALGGAVRGALVFGLSHARREALDSLPLLAICLAGWLALGGPEPRGTILAAWRRVTWPVLLACSACTVWGFVVSGAALGALPGILQPPAIYGAAGLLAALGASLVLASGWRARRSPQGNIPDAGTLGIALIAALALAYLAGLGALLALAPAAGLLGASILCPAAGRPGLALRTAGGALCAVFLYGAGAMAVPGAGVPSIDVLTLAGLLGAGAAFAGLVAAGASRRIATFWLVLLFLALVLLALGAGRVDMIGLCGALLAVMLLFLLLPRRTPQGRLGDAALCCLGLLVAASAVFLA